MKRARHIIVFLLSLTLFYLGAGVAFIHICSSRCKMEQACGNRVHELRKKSCCASKQVADKQVDTSCQCVTLSYQADFYPGVLQFVLPQVVCCVLGYLALFICIFFIPGNEVLSEAPAHAPPSFGGRDRLTFHSVLII